MQRSSQKSDLSKIFQRFCRQEQVNQVSWKLGKMLHRESMREQQESMKTYIEHHVINWAESCFQIDMLLKL